MSDSYAVDLARGYAPLTFCPAQNPGAQSPEILEGDDGRYLRLAVEAQHAALDERCEIRDAKRPMRSESWHGFALRLAPGFPSVDRRFVAAQIKANNGDSPLFALRVSAGRLWADWRIGDARVELHEALARAGWLEIALGCVGDRIELWVGGRHVASARASFARISERRFLKIGPYRDRDPAWGAAPAAVHVRDIRAGSRAFVLNQSSI